jgi:hypothetical protein
VDYSSILTVTTPATFSLVDLATVKDEFEITDSSADVRLGRWLREATDAIEGAIGRVLRAETVSEAIRAAALARDHPGEHFYPRRYPGGMPPLRGLHLRRYPIVSIAALLEDDVALDPASDYEADSEAGILYRLSGDVRVPWAAQTLVVSYTGGYASLDTVPGDLQTACLTLLKHRLAARTRDPMLKQISVPGVSERQYWVGGVGQNPGLPPEVVGLIERFRDGHA